MEEVGIRGPLYVTRSAAFSRVSILRIARRYVDIPICRHPNTLRLLNRVGVKIDAHPGRVALPRSNFVPSDPTSRRSLPEAANRVKPPELGPAPGQRAA